MSSSLGITSLQSTVITAIEQTSQAFQNSDINKRDLKVTLAGFELFQFEEDPARILDDLYRLIEDEHAQERRTAPSVVADVVVLMTGNYLGTAFGATHPDILGNPTAELAFAIREARSATNFMTFSHELGHVFGARHQQCNIYDRNCDDEEGPEHGYAFKTGCWPFRKERTTIMHLLRQHWDRQLNYSNPDVNIKGKQTGLENTNDVTSWLRGVGCEVADFVVPENDFLTVQIIGGHNAPPNTTVQLSADVKGGTIPYSYQWQVDSTGGTNYGGVVSTSSTAQVVTPNQTNGKLWVRLTVTSNDSQTATDWHIIHSAEYLQEPDPDLSRNLENAYTSATPTISLSAFPNPFRNEIIFQYSLSEPSFMELNLTDCIGRVTT